MRPCDRCAEDAPRLYRVVIEPNGPWILVCDRCWPTVSENNPAYRYGGTWTARRRD